MIDHGGARLSPFVKSLRQKLFEWMNDRDVRRAAGEYRGLSEPEFDAWVSRMAASPQNLLLIIAERQTMTPAGFCYLAGLSAIHRHGRLGLAIGEPALRRRGLGGDAVRALVAHGFRDLGLERIHLDALADNDEAIRLYERCGFRREGVLRRHFFVDGAFRDAVAMAILKDDPV